MPKIYTKTGDDGSTVLITGKRVPKDDIRVEAYGTVDELNSSLGLVLTHQPMEKLQPILARIQSDLFDIGSELACPNPEEAPMPLPVLRNEVVEEIEGHIDLLSLEVPPLNQFILPGGSAAASFLHQARTVCRRAERRVVTLSHLDSVNENIIVYLNRLSDLLFVMARVQNHHDEVPETPWKPRTT